LETPEKSNRQIAEALKVSHSTVNAVRKDMESTGQVVQLNKTIGADGKARPRKALEDTSKKDEGRPCGTESRNDCNSFRFRKYFRKCFTCAESAQVLE